MRNQLMLKPEEESQNTIDTRNPHRKLPHRVTYNAEGLEGKQFHTHLYPVTEREDAPLFV